MPILPEKSESKLWSIPVVGKLLKNDFEKWLKTDYYGYYCRKPLKKAEGQTTNGYNWH